MAVCVVCVMGLGAGLSGCASLHGAKGGAVDDCGDACGGWYDAGAESNEFYLAAGDGGEDSRAHGFFHTVIFYLPNRVLDLFDIVRLRVHAGPGIGIGARATEMADVYLGSYASVYAGLPGPRMRPLPKLPFGVETFSGAEVSVVDATVSGGIGPGYSPSEFGANLYLLLIGADVGLDPIEALDFITGFLLIHLRDDEL